MQNGHLSFEEIEQLSQQKGPAENQAHMADCRQCRELLANYQAVGAKLDQLPSVRIGARNTMNCPDERVWFDVAAGTLPSEESLKQVQHATECDNCGRKLKNATHLFDDTVSAEEEQVISSIPSASREVQKQLAARLAAESAPASQKEKRTTGKRGFFSWRLPGLVFAGLALTAFLGFRGYQSYEIRQARQELGSKYEKGRPTEYRIAGVAYSSPSAIRGATELSYVDVPDWLNQPVLVARAAFLAHDWAVATAALEKARAAGNNSAEVLDDLVVAYALQAESPRNNDFYQKALTLTDDVIQRYPSDAGVYFNRALILEQLSRRQDAIVSLHKFIELEPDSRWKDEANARLRLLQ